MRSTPAGDPADDSTASAPASAPDTVGHPREESDCPPDRGGRNAQIERSSTAGEEMVILSGEIDAADADAFTPVVLDAIRDAGDARVVIDLTRVTFLGSKGLALVATAARAAAAADVTIRGVTGAGNRPVISPLTITGVIDTMSWTPTHDPQPNHPGTDESSA